MSWLTDEQLKKFRKVGRNVKVSTEARIFGYNNIEIGDNTRIDAGSSLLASADGAELLLGSNIHIAVNAILMASGGIFIGDFSTVGFGSQIISASDSFDGSCLVGPVFPPAYLNVKRDEVVLERHSIITSNCCVMPGVRMGEGSVLGAMSMLKCKTDPWRLYVGIPAKRLLGHERSKAAIGLGEKWIVEFDKIHQAFADL